MAHASFWNMGTLNYHAAENIVHESWASGVQWELTRMVYTNYWRTYSRLRYTGVVQDMIDGEKTVTSYYYFTEDEPWAYAKKVYNDQISGYTIRQIEDALDGESTWNGWRNNIKNSYNNETEDKLHETFTFWNMQ